MPGRQFGSRWLGGPSVPSPTNSVPELADNQIRQIRHYPVDFPVA